MQIEKLEGASNWTYWKFQITILLESNEVQGAVTGELQPPIPLAAVVRPGYA